MTGFGTVVQVTNLKSAVQAARSAPCYLMGWQVPNVGTARRFLKFYDALPSAIVAGTTVGLFELMIPPNDGGFITMLPKPIAIKNALSLRATTARGWTDTTDPSDYEVEPVFFFA